MAAVSSLLHEDQFLCSICLDVFTDPVTIPCGHNFCKTCITEHWSVNVPCQCPLCKELHEKKPDLRINTVLSEMASQLRLSVQKETSSSSEEQLANTGEVLCDYCTETKQKALKSCLDCLVSYCETHLEPHQRIQALKRHKLVNPVENLESRICKKHERPLEQFCKTDQVCVCGFCIESEHKSHQIVSLREEYEAKKAVLSETEAEVQKMIKERQVKIEDFKQSVKLSKEDADRETATSVQVFTALIRSVEEGLAQLIDLIKEKHNATEKQAEDFIKVLEEEISELTKRNTEVEAHSRNKDHLQFLQNFSSLKTPPPTKDWKTVKVYSSYEGTVRTALTQLEETLSREMKMLCADAELKKYKQYSVDVTLDPETAYPKLILSDDGKQVSHRDAIQNLSASPKRFLSYFCVVGKQSFSSGRSYYEVQVGGKTDWLVGVARESINRKVPLTFSPQKGLWTVWLDGKEIKAYTDPPVRLCLNSKPQKVGVFVDYEVGLVSFYDVDAPALIYSFTGCSFTEKLYPIFNPRNNNGGRNSTPLIICPVNKTDKNDHTSDPIVLQRSTVQLEMSKSKVKPNSPLQICPQNKCHCVMMIHYIPLNNAVHLLRKNM
uniref:E3 ubiquitin-protein ligase TRIM21-like n=1 Tax=Labrus bergylta TaxID=56723 RepID=A0A3Q3G9Y7_9LABR|nr:E3 ubiquitin-protein ligase TRIM21-like [Labrus bergylta]